MSFGHSLSKRYLQLLGIMAEHGCSADDAREVLLADRAAFVGDAEDERPMTIRSWISSTPPSVAMHTVATISLTSLFASMLSMVTPEGDDSEDARCASFRERATR